jgi:hypothetical protein
VKLADSSFRAAQGRDVAFVNGVVAVVLVGLAAWFSIEALRSARPAPGGAARSPSA